MQYNYRMTAAINDLVGNRADPTDLQGLRKQLLLIKHEIEEGEGNLAELAQNPDALRDDVADVLFTTYGLMHRLGFTADEAQLKLDGVTTGTNYELVGKAHEAGKPEGGTTAPPDVLLAALNDNLTAIETAIVTEESRDVQVAVIQRLLAVTYLLGIVLDYPVDEDYREVVASNLSKFDDNQADADATRAKYLKLGVETIQLTGTMSENGGEKSVIITKSSHDQVGTDGTRFPGGKWLKSINFAEPVYRSLREEAVA